MDITTHKLAVGTRDAAQLLSVSRRTVQNLVSAGLLRAKRIGRRVVIPISELEAFLRDDRSYPSARVE